MLSPRMVSALKRTNLWAVGKSVHGVVSPPACAAIHGAVTNLPPRLVPEDLRLKHAYDYAVVYVDPKNITREFLVGEWNRRVPGSNGRIARFGRWYETGGGWKSAKRHLTRNLHGRFVADGDWDTHVKPFEIRPTFEELFGEGRPPQETTEYQRLRTLLEQGRYAWTGGCRSVEELDAYFAALIAAYEDIKANGYRTQEALGQDGSDEIRVCIDRSGQFGVFGGGTHRLSMALVLGLDAVPVLLKRVHAAWVADCSRRFGTGTLTASIEAGLHEFKW